jgi:hypothetical protein
MTKLIVLVEETAGPGSHFETIYTENQTELGFLIERIEDNFDHRGWPCYLFLMEEKGTNETIITEIPLNSQDYAGGFWPQDWLEY